MAATTITSAPRNVLARHWGKFLLGAAALMALLVVLLFAVVAPRWPFRKGDMRKRLETTMGATVQFGAFHQIFFPHPGCVMEDVRLTPSDPAHPKVVIKKLTVRGLYWGLIGSQKHLESLSFDGMQLYFPADRGKKESTNAQGKSDESVVGGDTRFDEIYAKNSQIIFEADEKHPQPRSYDIYQLVLKNFSTSGPIHFSSQLKIPEPVANVDVSGTFGPIDRGDLGASPLAGTFEMKNANLATFHALFGTVNANGSFNGKLGQLLVNASTYTPKFGLTDTGHALPLKTNFTATVNGTNGDIQFEPVHAVLGKTQLLLQGQLADGADKKKVLAVDIASNDARIEDLLFLFVNDKSPLSGPTQFKMKVKIPSGGDEPFVKRLEAQAHFGIERSKFTSPETQQKVSHLSEDARGNPKNDDPAPVVTNLVGDLTVKNAIANFSRLDCDVPGASAKLHGKYALDTHAVDLHGTLQTSVNLSQATTGFKSFLMKVVEVAKKKKQKEGATVPVKITGTYDKPEFGLDAVAEH